MVLNFNANSFHVLNTNDEKIQNLSLEKIDWACSSINNKCVKTDFKKIKFLVSGHFHGSSNNNSGLPAASLLANLDTLNSLNAAFAVCLGDLFLNVEKDYKNFEKYLFKKINFPLFNAVGNHDVDNDLYEKRYSETYESFDIGANRFIVLNTELNNGDIKGEQLSFLKNNLANNKKIANIFIFMHRTLWAEDDERLSKLFPDNTKSSTSTNFQSEVLPLIKKASKKSEIYLFSGSIGGQSPASFLYHRYAKGITYIATAIRDLPRDAVLIVNIIDDKVIFSTLSLNQNKVLPLEEYTVEWWEKHGFKTKPFNWRLVPLYIWQMITHRYFWYGIAYVLSFILIIYFYKYLKNKRKREKN